MSHGKSSHLKTIVRGQRPSRLRPRRWSPQVVCRACATLCRAKKFESPETRVGKGSPSADASAAKKPPRSRPLPRPLTPHAKLELAPRRTPPCPGKSRQRATTRQAPSLSPFDAGPASRRIRVPAASSDQSPSFPGCLERPREARRRTRARSPAATIGTPSAPPAPSPAPPASVQVTAPPTSLPRSSTQRGDRGRRPAPDTPTHPAGAQPRQSLLAGQQPRNRGDQPDARFRVRTPAPEAFGGDNSRRSCRASDGCQLRAGWRASERLEEASSTSTADAANWRSEDAPTRRAGTSVCGVPRSANCPQSAQVVLQSVIESRWKLGTECVTKIPSRL